MNEDIMKELKQKFQEMQVNQEDLDVSSLSDIPALKVSKKKAIQKTSELTKLKSNNTSQKSLKQIDEAITLKKLKKNDNDSERREMES